MRSERAPVRRVFVLRSLLCDVTLTMFSCHANLVIRRLTRGDAEIKHLIIL
jgi:hypothetical protein